MNRIQPLNRPDKKWMSVTEAAEYVSKKYGPVSVQFVRRIIQKRAVAILRLGKFKLVEASDLDAYIQKRIQKRVESPLKKRKAKP